MPSITRPINRCLTAAILAAAGTPAFTAHAQDARLSVSAMPAVVTTGQTAQVRVRAHLPAGAYAFASAFFEMHAAHPAWTSVSSGAISGTDVLGIVVNQLHNPSVGVFANPANPLQVWTGAYTATSTSPTLVKLTADPATFAVYPGKYTTSSTYLRAEGGSDWLLVNPLAVQGWFAAPAPGTTATVHDDVIVDGKIITAENPASAVLIGLLVPAVQKSPDSIVRFDGLPESFTASVQVERDMVPTDQLSINFAKITLPGAAPGGVNVCLADGSVRFARYTAFNGGVRVATGDLSRPRPDQMADLVVDSVPPMIGARIGPGIRGVPGVRAGNNVIWTLRYEQPVNAIVRDAQGQTRTVVIDSLEVQAPVAGAAAAAGAPHNIKQLGLGLHTYEATGVRRMTIAPGRVR